MASLQAAQAARSGVRGRGLSLRTVQGGGWGAAFSGLLLLVQQRLQRRRPARHLGQPQALAALAATTIIVTITTATNTAARGFTRPVGRRHGRLTVWLQLAHAALRVSQVAKRSQMVAERRRHRRQRRRRLRRRHTAPREGRGQ